MSNRTTSSRASELSEWVKQVDPGSCPPHLRSPCPQPPPLYMSTSNTSSSGLTTVPLAEESSVNTSRSSAFQFPRADLSAANTRAYGFRAPHPLDMSALMGQNAAFSVSSPPHTPLPNTPSFVSFVSSEDTSIYYDTDSVSIPIGVYVGSGVLKGALYLLLLSLPALVSPSCLPSSISSLVLFLQS